MKINNEAYFKGASSVTMPKSVDINNATIEFKYDDDTINAFRMHREFEYLECIVFTTFKNPVKPEKGAKVFSVQLNFKLTQKEGGETISLTSKANKRMIDEICKNAVSFQRFNIRTEGPDAGIECNMPLLRIKAEMTPSITSKEALVPLLVLVLLSPLLILLDPKYPFLSDALNAVTMKTSVTQEQALAIPPLQNYNNETKNSLLLKRKMAVEKSVFKDILKDEYYPSEEVFGGVQDKMPWISLKNSVCIDPKLEPFHVSKGNSALSRFIENPNVLVGIMPPYVMNINENSKNCTSVPLKFIPTKMTYDPKNKLITSYYPMSYSIMNQTVKKNGRSVPLYFTLTGLNAKDLGYKFATVSHYDGVYFTNNGENISDDVVGFRDFIHVGGSCGVPGGCNNLSPYQPAHDFRFISIPAEITFKLWKDKPIAKLMPADFEYKIIFNVL